MKKLFNLLLEFIFMFLFSGLVYVIIELLFRGYSFVSMFILGGICGVFLCFLNNIFTYDMDFLLQIGISTVVCTLLEWICGLIVNQDFTIWDYRYLCGTFANQQCNIFFCFAWMGISAICIPVLDYIEWVLFQDKDESKKPYYKIFGKKIF